MHEKKAEVLAKLEEASRGIDDALGHMANVALHPGEHGWSHSISAAVIGLPIVALSALAVDVGEIMVKAYERRGVESRFSAGQDRRRQRAATAEGIAPWVVSSASVA